MKVFILSLREDVKKRAVLLAQCEELGLEAEIFHAIEGSILEQSFVNLHVDNYPECMLTRGEIGCALSHQAIYKKMIDDNLPMALILEDDARLGTNIVEVLNKLSVEINNHDRVYLLTPPETYSPTIRFSLDNTMEFYRVSSACSTAGYVITRQAAKSLININTPIKWEADCWGMFDFMHDLDIYCLLPPVIEDGDPNKLTSGLEQQRAINADKRFAMRNKLKKEAAGYQFRRIRRLLRKKFQREVRY